MWEGGHYSDSPGTIYAPAAWSALGIRRGDTVLDVGAGTGDASAWFAEHGARPTMLDITGAGFRHDLPHIIAPAWAFTAEPHDWLFSSDIFEHLPPAHVAATLRVCAAAARRGAWLRISTRPDGCGAAIGETLHLTVRPASWWATRLAMHWHVAGLTSGEDAATFTCLHKPLDKPHTY